MRQSSGTHHISQIGSLLLSMENANSDKVSIICGVPQDSILGPLIFLIYFNDMPQAVDSVYCSRYYMPVIIVWISNKGI